MPDTLLPGWSNTASRFMQDDTFALLHEIRPPAPSLATIQPITEGQFRAIVRGFDTQETDEGTAYTKDGHPWRYVRDGDRVVVMHRFYTLPPKEYMIV